MVLVSCTKGFRVPLGIHITAYITAYITARGVQIPYTLETHGTTIILSYNVTLADGRGSSDSDIPPELFCAACNKLFKSDKA